MYPASPSGTLKSPMADAARRRIAQGMTPAAPSPPPMAPPAASPMAAAPARPMAAPAPATGAAMGTPAAPSGGVTGYVPGAAGPAMGGAVMGARGGYDQRAGGGRQGGGGDTGPTGDDPDAEFNKRGNRALTKRVMRMQIRDMLRAQPDFWNSIEDLQNQASTDHFSDEERAQFVAPYMESIDDQFDQAQAGVDQAMFDRGLTDSSYNALTQGAMAGRAAAAKSGTIHNLFDSEKQRKLMAGAQLRDMLSSVMGRAGGQAASIGTSLSSQDLQRRLAEAQNGGLFEDLFGTIGGLGGMAVGMGWRPFGSGR